MASRAPPPENAPVRYLGVYALCLDAQERILLCRPANAVQHLGVIYCVQALRGSLQDEPSGWAGPNSSNSPWSP